MSSDDARQAGAQALAVSRRYLANGDLAGSLRFCRKSLSLYPDSAAAQSFLRELQGLEKEGMPQASTSKAAPSPAAAAAPRPPPSPAAEAPPQRAFTPKQVAMIKRVRACRPGAYYEILELEKSCSDGDIKKAFRKSCLLLHPDKCGAPGTDEAFKIVAKAAEVLGDPNKRAHFDRYGTDPDDRRANMSSGFSGASPFAAGGRRGGMYTSGEDITPEDLFNMFFGGGGGFQSGFGPNVRVYQPGMRRPAGAAGQQQQATTPAWVQMLPLIVLCLFSLLSYLPAILTTAPPPMPGFRFTAAGAYNLGQATHLHSVNYFVNPPEFARSHVFQAVLDANPSITVTEGGKPAVEVLQTQSLASLPRVPAELHKFERQVEAAYVDRVSDECRHETTSKQERLHRAGGFLGIGRDVEELRRIHAEAMPGCDALKRMGYRLS